MRKRKRNGLHQGELLIWTSNPIGTLAKEILSFPFHSVLDDDKTPLCELMCKYGSDKGTGWHNYTKLYHHLLDKKRSDIQNVFEVGLGTNFLDINSSMGVLGKPGASLRAWRDYFPNAFIRGADIDQRILFEERQINTYYCDQTNLEDITTLWETLSGIQFDLIVDDGLHEFSANRTFVENSFDKLANTGLYVIEDVLVNNVNSWQGFLRTLSVQSAIVKIPSRDNRIDNCLVLISKDEK